jgi:hypothetical protein
MEVTTEPSLSTKLLSLGFFLLLTISSGTWFAISSINLISDIRYQAPVIAYDEGSMYMLGCTIGLLGVLAGGAYYVLLGRKLPKKVERILIRIMLSGVVIMFVFPHVANFYVESEIEHSKYYICEKLTYEWLLYKKYYYTDTPETCGKLVAERGK